MILAAATPLTPPRIPQQATESDSTVVSQTGAAEPQEPRVPRLEGEGQEPALQDLESQAQGQDLCFRSSGASQAMESYSGNVWL